MIPRRAGKPSSQPNCKSDLGAPGRRDDADESKRIVYFASDLGRFPIHTSIAHADKTLVISDGINPEVPASFPDVLLKLPHGIRFESFAPAPSKWTDEIPLR